MAMAVMNQKSLHIHAVPVLILGLGLVLMSSIALAKVSNSNLSGQNLTHLWNARLFTVKPATNGFFHISRYGANNQASLNELSNQNGPLSVINDVGRVAQINAVVNGTKN